MGTISFLKQKMHQAAHKGKKSSLINTALYRVATYTWNSFSRLSTSPNLFKVS